MPAILNEWLPSPAKYHKLSPYKDESVSWSETNGIIVFRQKHDCILMRGDTRPPEEVLTAQGFTPTVPMSAIADRRNESVLRELAMHFPARISFTKEKSVAQRYMHNAAVRQQKQFSYIYYVNIKNMQALDIRLNLEEGRIGRYAGAGRISSLVLNWVDEHVVIGNFIPVNNIVKVEKYEIVPKQPNSALLSQRIGFMLKGVYYLNSESQAFDYEDIDTKDPLFKYKSAVMITFLAHRVPKHFEREKRKEVYGIDSIDYNTLCTSYETPNPRPTSVKLTTWRNSLPSNRLDLIRLNFSLEDDSEKTSWKRQWSYTKRQLKEGLKSLQHPAKIYIIAAEARNNDAITQVYGGPPFRREVFEMPLTTFAELLKECCPISREINFHLLIKGGFMLAAPLLKAATEVGFKNCFVTSYLTPTHIVSSLEDYSYTPIKLDFGTQERYDPGRKAILHHQDKPELDDNKAIAYWTKGKVCVEGYRDWIKANSERYSKEYRKDLWIQNYTAILSELISWLDYEVTQLSPTAKMTLPLETLLLAARFFDNKMINDTFNKQEFFIFLLCLFKALDIIALSVRCSVAQPLVHDVLKKASQRVNPGGASSTPDPYQQYFRANYENLRATFVPILPIEFEEVGYDVKTVTAPDPVKVFEYNNMTIPILVGTMLLGNAPDFSKRL